MSINPEQLTEGQYVSFYIGPNVHEGTITSVQEYEVFINTVDGGLIRVGIYSLIEVLDTVQSEPVEDAADAEWLEPFAEYIERLGL